MLTAARRRMTGPVTNASGRPGNPGKEHGAQDELHDQDQGVAVPKGQVEGVGPQKSLAAVPEYAVGQEDPESRQAEEQKERQQRPRAHAPEFTTKRGYRPSVFHLWVVLQALRLTAPTSYPIINADISSPVQSLAS